MPDEGAVHDDPPAAVGSPVFSVVTPAAIGTITIDRAAIHALPAPAAT